MCDHYLSNQRENELTGDEWRRVLENLAKLGVHSVILSGGEPLMREDIVELLDFATANGLAVGMLTNGTMPHENKQTRGRVVKAIHRNVKWIAVSVEGTEIEDQQIRKPDAGSRIDLLQELVAGLKGGPNISATVTLQKGNIDMNLRDACAFIGKHLGIAQVNFKLVTGAWHALHRRPGYLLSEKELGSFLYFLWNYSADLDTEPQSNLGYLRRCFANDIFQEGDVVEGAPLRSFYVNNPLRCFTPFLFSLIDSDGKVYPCCHLYRDNHGADPKSVYFRERHEMGNLRNTAFDFRSVWNGDAYVRERQRLARIAPNNPDFEPCGECTRHCQHNRVLTALYNAYKDKLDELARLACPQRDPVWF
ncbi:MAG: hypothetical protein A2107_03980 [Verrucomicrobia bacterium GWF2_62_7]|nr:MAG: hypothetical protein A2107_03980 [Verrucomicrobia bacterium GWF2_62_7]